jgi:hypothetical protein
MNRQFNLILIISGLSLKSIVNNSLRKFLTEIGRNGGRKSRRRLTSDEARRMVRIREGRKVYRQFHARCFWSSPPDLKITEEDLSWVARKLREQGGREGWEAADKLSP